MLRTIAIYLVAATALFAFLLPAQDSDGSLVVMDRLYYEHCKSDFYSDCNLLSRNVDSFEQYAIPQLESLTNTIHEALDSNGWTKYWLQVHLEASEETTTAIKALQWAEITQSVLGESVGLADSLLSSSLAFVDDMHDLISVTSNTFPLEVTSTNLTLVVVVSNYFEMASNELDHAQNVYTNFLNYYRGVEDYMLDQYRATVTNLLDWSNFANWIDYSLWKKTSWVSDSWHNTSANFTFWAIPWGIDAHAMVFNGGGGNNVARWDRYRQTLNDNATFSDWLAFNLQGIHDSAEYGTRALLQVQELFIQASTNRQFTMTWLNSQTNGVAEFFTAPKGYTAQVSKISKSRNLFQRIEHWLSAIARNTDMGESDEGENADSSEDSQEVYDVISNDVATASVRVNELFVPLASLTNATAGVQSLVDSVTDVLDNFKSTPSVRSSGLRSGDSSAPATFKLMSTGFIESTFERSDLHPSGLPDWVGCDDTYEVFGFARTAATWIHHFFGVIWLASALALLVFYARWLSSWVVTLWYRLLGFLAKICTFTWGGS